MGLLTVDETKCRQDGICAAECPRRIIEMEGEGGFPTVAAEREAFCMRCGHCSFLRPGRVHPKRPTRSCRWIRSTYARS